MICVTQAKASARQNIVSSNRRSASSPSFGAGFHTVGRTKEENPAAGTDGVFPTSDGRGSGGLGGRPTH
jgi:hypothetical protein